MMQDNIFMEMKHLTSMEYFERRFDAVSRQLGFKAGSREEFMVWKNCLRSELKHISGINSMHYCNLNPIITERIETDGFIRERILLETEPGIIMSLYALIPGDIEKDEKRPAIIAAHGHSSAGKYAIAGRKDIASVAAQIEEMNYDYGVKLVKEGFVVFCADARGFGERLEAYMQDDSVDIQLGSSCFHLNNMAMCLGQTVTGMWTWDLIRLVDYIETRNDCDNDKIGCAGLSGGGLQVLWLAALDDRIKCTAVSGFFYGFKQSLLNTPNCSCNYVPHLWEKADVGDIGALIAPRPLLIETGDQDIYNGKDGLGNVLPQVDITRKAYGLFGSEDYLYYHVFEGGHRWNGEKAIPWLKRWL